MPKSGVEARAATSGRMSMFVASLLIGMLLGSVLGVLTMAVCVMAGRRDAAVRVYTDRRRIPPNSVRAA